MAEQQAKPRKPRRGKPPDGWKEHFLAALKITGNVSAAADVGKVCRTLAYETRKGDDDFARRWDECLEIATDNLELEARRRAMKSSDLLLIFLLKSRRPELYCDQARIHHTGGVVHAHISEETIKKRLAEAAAVYQAVKAGLAEPASSPQATPEPSRAPSPGRPMLPAPGPIKGEVLEPETQLDVSRRVSDYWNGQVGGRTSSSAIDIMRQSGAFPSPMPRH